MNLALTRIVVAILIFGCTGLFVPVCQAQSFQYPPYGAQRGRMVARDGIGHSVRYRWGNGLTPTGGAVLTEAIGAFAPAVVALAGRDVDADGDTRSRDAARSATRDRLAIAQEQANDLLVRTARLIEPNFSPSPTPSQKDTPQSTPLPDSDFGSDPWPNTPNNPAASSPQTSTTVSPTGSDPWTNEPDNQGDPWTNEPDNK